MTREEFGHEMKAIACLEHYIKCDAFCGRGKRLNGVRTNLLRRMNRLFDIAIEYMPEGEDVCKDCKDKDNVTKEWCEYYCPLRK